MLSNFSSRRQLFMEIQCRERGDGEGTMRWHHENSSGFDHEMPFHRALIIIIETRLLVVS